MLIVIKRKTPVTGERVNIYLRGDKDIYKYVKPKCRYIMCLSLTHKRNIRKNIKL